MPEQASFDVVVIGGGAGGTLVAAHLVDGTTPIPSVAVVEPRGELARGVAYSTHCPEHLLNVRAGGMSALDDRPGDFVDFLLAGPACADHDRAALAARFMPRMEYARYLSALLDGRPGRAQLHAFDDSVSDVLPAAGPAGGFHVQLAGGRRLHARAVVLASGNRPARLPVAQASLPAGALVDAWDYEAVAAIAPDTDVCILGAGLSMVDVVLSLQAAGHRGRVTSLSRRGLVPLPHAEPGPPAEIDVDALCRLGLGARTRMVRGAAVREEAAGRSWQGVLDALRPHVQSLWTSLDAAGQRRFLRHLVRHWDVHRHRIAPEVSRALEQASTSGRLQRLAGHLVAIEPGPPLEIRWRPRGGTRVSRLSAGVVVNALGVDRRIDRGPGLLAALCARGLLRPGPHGLGAATRGEGVVLGASGDPVPGLWTLGALRAGDLWESIAMPELRGQALQVAAAARAHLAGLGP